RDIVISVQRDLADNHLILYVRERREHLRELCLELLELMNGPLSIGLGVLRRIMGENALDVLLHRSGRLLIVKRLNLCPCIGLSVWKRHAGDRSDESRNEPALEL